VRVSSAAGSRATSRLEGFRIVVVVATLMWVAEIVDLAAGHRLDRYGIQPRDSDGLVGVAAAPFLHAGFGHLIANTVPLVVMGVAIALRGAARLLAVTAIVMLFSGLGTWLFAPPGSIHIGASGVVFGYAAYLLTFGFFERNLLWIAISLVIGFVWGGALLGGLLPQVGISWQGHLFGAIGGIVAARALSQSRRGS
jgi:membrane associated rhomboid family serine protease